ncbi:MAG: DUF7483 domain-containing protein [Pseudobdellovibrionaceae bacterium]
MADELVKSTMSSQRRQFFYKLSSFLPKEFRENVCEHLDIINENSPIEEERRFETHFRYALGETIRLGLLKRRDFFKLSVILSSAGLLQWLLPSQADASGIIPFAFMKRATASTSYVDDVFSTYLYTGNGGTQTITNGIDLAGKGGLVWIKTRNSATANALMDSVRGMSYELQSSNTNAQSSYSAVGAMASGFQLLNGRISVNNTNDSYVSWTFRKAAKFFDIVTYTGNGVAGRAISHSLGIAPGMIVVKRTDIASTTGWAVWHNSATGDLWLNLTNTQGGSYTQITAAASSTFTVGSGADVNASGGTYVAYLYAHDTSASGIIQCGSVVKSGTTTVNLGWEPQYVLIKSAGTTDWLVFDSMRGMTANGTDPYLYPNLSNSEFIPGVSRLNVTSTGFTLPSAGLTDNTYIYLAIRRPNKPPTSGTQIFNTTLYTGDGTTSRTINTTINADSFWMFHRGGGGFYHFDRLRGNNNYLLPSSTLVEAAFSATAWGMDKQNAIYMNSNSTYINAGGVLNGVFAFRRSPGVFDIVTYAGDGVYQRNVNHNLGVIPELMIIKSRTDAASGYWWVYAAPIGIANALKLHLSDAMTAQGGAFGATQPTASVFTLAGGGWYINNTSNNYVAYLFATKAGISMVGSYTGDGTTNGSKVIACGFTTGARFILIKRTDSTGDWFVWDTVRGITASANEPHLSLNTTSAEVTTDDSIDPDNSGFKVKQNTATNINVTSATYIFLAIA